jgi:hypothetical protein
VNSVEARSITAWITVDRRSIAVGPRDVVSAHLCLLSWRSAPMSRAIVDAYLLRDRRRPGPLLTLKNVEILFLRITGAAGFMAAPRTVYRNEESALLTQGAASVGRVCHVVLRLYRRMRLS